jgi:hypothetical protein
LGDTDDLELPGRQNELVREVMKLGKPTVGVVLGGRPFAMVQLSQSVPVGPEQLAIWDRQMRRVVEPGAVDVSVGANVQQLESVDLRVQP